MKTKIKYILSMVIIAFFASCKKDNFKPPGTALSGRIVYKGEAIGVEQDRVNFELWQPGFGKNAAIGVAVAQEGSYSSLLFNGNYKLTMPDNNGPWVWRHNAAGKPDSLAINLQGDQTLDLEVTPYYMIRDPKFSVSSGKVTGTFNLEQIITGSTAKNVQKVSLYISKTQFVSGSYALAFTDVTGSTLTSLNNISLSVAIPTPLSPTQNYVFARIGVTLAGTDKLIFSPIQKITF
jgi:hypothetical protein